MITSINEFYFSNHYQSDSDNRLSLRVAHITLLNKVKPEFETIFKQKALYNLKIHYIWTFFGSFLFLSPVLSLYYLHYNLTI